MEPEKTRIDAILDAYDHRLVEARQREAEQESREADFGRGFAHFRDEVASLIMTSVGLQLASRGHGSEISQEDRVHALDGRQETMPAIAIRLFPGSLHPVPGVEQYPSLAILGARREQKIVMVADARLRLPGDEGDQDQQGGKGTGDDRPQDQGKDQNQQGQQQQGQDQQPSPPQAQEPAEETMALSELTPQRLRDRLTQLVADAFGRLPRPPR